MGAQDFCVVVGSAESMEKAFQSARTEARWEYGHGGYTGTIAEKDTWIDCGAAPQRWTMDMIFNALRHGNDPELPLLKAHLGDLKFTEAFASFEDKWGPVAGFKLDNDAYGFCGSASS